MTASPSTAASAPVAPKRVIDVFVIVALLGIAAVYVRAFFFTPPEANQGVGFKILFLHAPSAVGAYIAFSVMGLMSVLYLWMRDERADRLADASVEVAVMFFTLTIITGSIYAHTIWGTWWKWSDPRLTLSLLLWIVGIGYMVVRRTFDDEDARARYSAVLGVMAVLLIPFVHLSVLLFKSIHPPPVLLAPPPQTGLGAAAPAPEPAMPFVFQIGLYMGFIAASVLSIALIRARYALARQNAALAALEEGVGGGGGVGR